MSALDELLGLLPVDGRRVPLGEVMRRAHVDLHMSAGNAGGLLLELCSSKRAAAETIGGWQFVRRTSAAEAATDFPLRRRPYHPPPRFTRRAPRPELAARAHAGGAR